MSLLEKLYTYKQSYHAKTRAYLSTISTHPSCIALTKFLPVKLTEVFISKWQTSISSSKLLSCF